MAPLLQGKERMLDVLSLKQNIIDSECVNQLEAYICIHFVTYKVSIGYSQTHLSSLYVLSTPSHHTHTHTHSPPLPPPPPHTLHHSPSPTSSSMPICLNPTLYTYLHVYSILVEAMDTFYNTNAFVGFIAVHVTSVSNLTLSTSLMNNLCVRRRRGSFTLLFDRCRREERCYL